MNQFFYIRKHVFGATQSQFAGIAGVVQSQVSRWENGKRRPTIREMDRIRAAAIERKLSWNDRWFFETDPGGRKTPPRHMPVSEQNTTPRPLHTRPALADRRRDASSEHDATESQIGTAILTADGPARAASVQKIGRR